MEGARKRELSISSRKWGTGRVGGTSRGCLSTQLRASFVKWLQTSGSNLKVRLLWDWDWDFNIPSFINDSGSQEVNLLVSALCLLICLFMVLNTQATEMDFLVFIRTWSLVGNMQISKSCGKWLNLPHLNMLAATRKGSIGLHIGWSVSGQHELFFEWSVSLGGMSSHVLSMIGGCIREGKSKFSSCQFHFFSLYTFHHIITKGSQSEWSKSKFESLVEASICWV